jgi:hypothetical protein
MNWFRGKSDSKILARFPHRPLHHILGRVFASQHRNQHNHASHAHDTFVLTRESENLGLDGILSYPAGVYDIKFVAKDKTDAHSEGTVTVRYGNGTRKSFSNIRRGDFFRWWQRSWKRPPRGIKLR